MRLGFVIPTYPGEKRVALLPEDIDNFENELLLEHGFGQVMGISDEAYMQKGCEFAGREEIFALCDAVFCLKLLQEPDYKYLRHGQMIIGWTHPGGSGKNFYENVAIPMELRIVDLDNIYPTLYVGEKRIPVSFLPKNFIWKNSLIAGTASVQHALLACVMLPDSNTKVAVLGNGNVSQGAYNYMAKLNADIRMFYRKTLDDFYKSMDSYDIIINGIEVDRSVKHIMSKEQLRSLKKGCLVIDAAADAGNAIEGTHYTSIDSPVYEDSGILFYEVNNAPSLLYRVASREISKSFSRMIYKYDIKRFFELIKP